VSNRQKLRRQASIATGLPPVASQPGDAGDRYLAYMAGGRDSEAARVAREMAEAAVRGDTAAIGHLAVQACGDAALAFAVMHVLAAALADVSALVPAENG
jgi:hypothetical protein